VGAATLKHHYHPPASPRASTHRHQVKHGEGALALPDGSVYEGEFTEGEITGKGRRIYPCGMRYEGDLFRGEKHGQGKLRYADGSEYDGGWVEQRRQGSGKLVSAVNGQLNVYVASVACRVCLELNLVCLCSNSVYVTLLGWVRALVCVLQVRRGMGRPSFSWPWVAALRRRHCVHGAVRTGPA